MALGGTNIISGQVINKNEATAALRRVLLFLSSAGAPVTGETGTPQLSVAGGAFANTTNAVTELANGWYYVELTQAETNADGQWAVRYDTAGTDECGATGMFQTPDPYDANFGLTNLDAAVTTRATPAQVNTEVDAALADVHLDHLIQTSGSVSDAGPSASDFDTDLTEASDDHYNEQVIVFISGNLAGQSARIKDYTGATKNIEVFPPLTEAPANGDNFVIVTGVLTAVAAVLRDSLDDHDGAADSLAKNIRWAAQALIGKVIRDSGTPTTIEVKDTDGSTKLVLLTFSTLGDQETRTPDASP